MSYFAIFFVISTNEKSGLVMCRVFIGSKFRKKIHPYPNYPLSKNTDSVHIGPTNFALSFCGFWSGFRYTSGHHYFISIPCRVPQKRGTKKSSKTLQKVPFFSFLPQIYYFIKITFGKIKIFFHYLPPTTQSWILPSYFWSFFFATLCRPLAVQIC